MYTSTNLGILRSHLTIALQGHTSFSVTQVIAGLLPQVLVSGCGPLVTLHSLCNLLRPAVWMRHWPDRSAACAAVMAMQMCTADNVKYVDLTLNETSSSAHLAVVYTDLAKCGVKSLAEV